jgi:hypothetical protein
LKRREGVRAGAEFSLAQRVERGFDDVQELVQVARIGLDE